HAEIGVDTFAVGYWSFGSISIAAVGRDAGLAFERDLLPDDIARGTVETIHGPLINPVRRCRAAAKSATGATGAARPPPATGRATAAGPTAAPRPAAAGPRCRLLV